jgi:hypothetical protein
MNFGSTRGCNKNPPIEKSSLSHLHPTNSIQKFGQLPNVIRESRFHRRRHTERPMNPAKSVIGKVQAVGGPKVVPFLTESILRRVRRVPGDKSFNRPAP